MFNLNFDRTQLKNFCRNNQISSLGVFGSYAKGQANKKSDLDLLARFSKTPSLFDLVRIEYELADLFKKKVDLLTPDSISPYLRERILNETKLIYEQR